MVCQCLASLMDDSSVYEGVLQAMLTRQLGQLQSQGSVRVEFSTADFPDEDALDRLRQRLDRTNVAVVRSDRLKSGDCRIQLVLGGLEVGVGQQWGALSALLLELSEGPPA